MIGEEMQRLFCDLGIFGVRNFVVTSWVSPGGGGWGYSLIGLCAAPKGMIFQTFWS